MNQEAPCFSCGVCHTDYKYDETFRETVTVNGIEMLKYEGVITDKYSQKHFIYCYSMIIDGVPCNLSGLSINKAELDGPICGEIRETVDEMAKTVRTKE